VAALITDYLIDFSISVVEAELVDKFNFVHSFVPWLIQFATRPRPIESDFRDKFRITSEEDKVFKSILVCGFHWVGKISRLGP
jgi:hypothetical protein